MCDSLLLNPLEYPVQHKPHWPDFSENILSQEVTQPKLSLTKRASLVYHSKSKSADHLLDDRVHATIITAKQNPALQPVGSSVAVLLAMLKSLLRSIENSKKNDTNEPELGYILRVIRVSRNFLSTHDTDVVLPNGSMCIKPRSKTIDCALGKLIEILCSGFGAVLRSNDVSKLKSLVDIICQLAIHRGGSCADMFHLISSLLQALHENHKDFNILGKQDIEHENDLTNTPYFAKFLAFRENYIRHTFTPDLIETYHPSIIHIDSGSAKMGRRRSIDSMVSDGTYLWLYLGRAGCLHCIGNIRETSSASLQEYPVTSQRIGQTWDDRLNITSNDNLWIQLAFLVGKLWCLNMTNGSFGTYTAVISTTKQVTMTSAQKPSEKQNQSKQNQSVDALQACKPRICFGGEEKQGEDMFQFSVNGVAQLPEIVFPKWIDHKCACMTSTSEAMYILRRSSNINELHTTDSLEVVIVPVTESIILSCISSKEDVNIDSMPGTTTVPLQCYAHTSLACFHPPCQNRENMVIIKAINCGGDAITTADGINYEPDTEYFVPNRRAFGPSEKGPRIDSSLLSTETRLSISGISNRTEMQMLYQTRRISEEAFSYHFHIPQNSNKSGRYLVRMRFVEFDSVEANRSSFQVTANGRVVARSLDPLTLCGSIRSCPASSELSFEIQLHSNAVNIPCECVHSPNLIIRFGDTTNSSKGDAGRPQVSTIIISAITSAQRFHDFRIYDAGYPLHADDSLLRQFFQSTQCYCDGDTFTILCPVMSHDDSQTCWESENAGSGGRKFTFSMSSGKLLEPVSLVPDLRIGIFNTNFRDILTSESHGPGAICYDVGTYTAWHVNYVGDLRSFRSTCEGVNITENKIQKYRFSQKLLKNQQNAFSVGHQFANVILEKLTRNVDDQERYISSHQVHSDWQLYPRRCEACKSNFFVHELTEKSLSFLNMSLAHAVSCIQTNALVDIQVPICLMKNIRAYISIFKRIKTRETEGETQVLACISIDSLSFKIFRDTLLHIINGHGMPELLCIEANKTIAAGLTLLFPNPLDQVNLLVRMINIHVHGNTVTSSLFSTNSSLLGHLILQFMDEKVLTSLINLYIQRSENESNLAIPFLDSLWKYEMFQNKAMSTEIASSIEATIESSIRSNMPSVANILIRFQIRLCSCFKRNNVGEVTQDSANETNVFLLRISKKHVCLAKGFCMQIIGRMQNYAHNHSLVEVFDHFETHFKIFDIFRRVLIISSNILGDFPISMKEEVDVLRGLLEQLTHMSRSMWQLICRDLDHNACNISVPKELRVSSKANTNSFTKVFQRVGWVIGSCVKLLVVGKRLSTSEIQNEHWLNTQLFADGIKHHNRQMSPLAQHLIFCGTTSKVDANVSEESRDSFLNHLWNSIETNPLDRKLRSRFRGKPIGNTVRYVFILMLYHANLLEKTCQLYLEFSSADKTPPSVPALTLTVWRKAVQFYRFIYTDKSILKVSMTSMAQTVHERAVFLFENVWIIDKEPIEDVLDDIVKFLRSKVNMDSLRRAIVRRVDRARDRAFGFEHLIAILKFLNGMKSNSSNEGVDEGMNNPSIVKLKVEFEFCILRWFGLDLWQTGSENSKANASLWATYSMVSSSGLELVDHCKQAYSMLLSYLLPLTNVHVGSHEQFALQFCVLDAVCIGDVPTKILLESNLFEKFDVELTQMVSAMSQKYDDGSGSHSFRLCLRDKALSIQHILAMSFLLKHPDDTRKQEDSNYRLLGKYLYGISDRLGSIFQYQKEQHQYFTALNQNTTRVRHGMKNDESIWWASLNPVIFRFPTCICCYKSHRDLNTFGHESTTVRVPTAVTSSSSFWIMFRLFVKDGMLCNIVDRPSCKNVRLKNSTYRILAYGAVKTPLVIVSFVPNTSTLRFSLRIKDMETSPVSNKNDTYVHADGPNICASSDWLDIRLKVYPKSRILIVHVREPNVPLWWSRLAMEKSSTPAHLHALDIESVIVLGSTESSKVAEHEQVQNPTTVYDASSMSDSEACFSGFIIGSLYLEIDKEKSQPKLLTSIPAYECTPLECIRRETVLSHELSRELQFLTVFFHTYFNSYNQDAFTDKKLTPLGALRTILQRILKALYYLIDFQDEFGLFGCQKFPMFQQQIIYLFKFFFRIFSPNFFSESFVDKENMMVKKGDSIVTDLFNVLARATQFPMIKAKPLNASKTTAYMPYSLELTAIRSDSVIELIRWFFNDQKLMAWRNVSLSCMNSILSRQDHTSIFKVSAKGRMPMESMPFMYWKTVAALIVLGHHEGSIHSGVLCTCHETLNPVVVLKVDKTSGSVLILKDIEEKNARVSKVYETSLENLTPLIIPLESSSLLKTEVVNVLLESLCKHSLNSSSAAIPCLPKEYMRYQLARALNHVVGAANVSDIPKLIECLTPPTKIEIGTKQSHNSLTGGLLYRLMKTAIWACEVNKFHIQFRKDSTHSETLRIGSLDGDLYHSVMDKFAEASTMIKSFKMLHMSNCVEIANGIITTDEPSTNPGTAIRWKCLNCWAYMHNQRACKSKNGSETLVCDLCGENAPLQIHKLSKIVGRPWQTEYKDCCLPDFEAEKSIFEGVSKQTRFDTSRSSSPSWCVPSLNLQPVSHRCAYWFMSKGIGVLWCKDLSTFTTSKGSDSKSKSDGCQEINYDCWSQQNAMKERENIASPSICQNYLDQKCRLLHALSLKARIDAYNNGLCKSKPLIHWSKIATSLPVRAPVMQQYFEIKVLSQALNTRNGIAIGLVEPANAHHSEAKWSPLTPSERILHPELLPFVCSYRQDGEIVCTVDKYDARNFSDVSTYPILTPVKPSYQKLYTSTKQTAIIKLKRNMTSNQSKKQQHLCELGRKMLYAIPSPGTYRPLTEDMKSKKIYFQVQVLAGGLSNSMHIGFLEELSTLESSSHRSTLYNGVFHGLASKLETHSPDLVWGHTGDIISCGLDLINGILHVSVSRAKKSYESVNSIHESAYSSVSYSIVSLSPKERKRHRYIPCIGCRSGSKLKLITSEEELTPSHFFDSDSPKRRNNYWLQIPVLVTETENTSENDEFQSKMEAFARPRVPSFKNGDVVGVGLDSLSGIIYFTKNGHLLPSASCQSKLDHDGKAMQLRPTVWLSQGSRIKIVQDCDQFAYSKCNSFTESVLRSSLPTDRIFPHMFDLPRMENKSQHSIFNGVCETAGSVHSKCSLILKRHSKNLSETNVRSQGFENLLGKSIRSGNYTLSFSQSHSAEIEFAKDSQYSRFRICFKKVIVKSHRLECSHGYILGDDAENTALAGKIFGKRPYMFIAVTFVHEYSNDIKMKGVMMDPSRPHSISATLDWDIKSLGKHQHIESYNEESWKYVRLKSALPYSVDGKEITILDPGCKPEQPAHSNSTVHDNPQYDLRAASNVICRSYLSRQYAHIWHIRINEDLSAQGKRSCLFAVGVISVFADSQANLTGQLGCDLLSWGIRSDLKVLFNGRIGKSWYDPKLKCLQLDQNSNHKTWPMDNVSVQERGRLFIKNEDTVTVFYNSNEGKLSYRLNGYDLGTAIYDLNLIGAEVRPAISVLWSSMQEKRISRISDGKTEMPPQSPPDLSSFYSENKMIASNTIRFKIYPNQHFSSLDPPEMKILKSAFKIFQTPKCNTTSLELDEDLTVSLFRMQAASSTKGLLAVKERNIALMPCGRFVHKNLSLLEPSVEKHFAISTEKSLEFTKDALLLRHTSDAAHLIGGRSQLVHWYRTESSASIIHILVDVFKLLSMHSHQISIDGLGGFVTLGNLLRSLSFCADAHTFWSQIRPFLLNVLVVDITKRLAQVRESLVSYFVCEVIGILLYCAHNRESRGLSVMLDFVEYVIELVLDSLQCITREEIAIKNISNSRRCISPCATVLVPLIETVRSYIKNVDGHDRIRGLKLLMMLSNCPCSRHFHRTMPLSFWIEPSWITSLWKDRNLRTTKLMSMTLDLACIHYRSSRQFLSGNEKLSTLVLEPNNFWIDEIMLIHDALDVLGKSFTQSDSVDSELLIPHCLSKVWALLPKHGVELYANAKCLKDNAELTEEHYTSITFPGALAICVSFSQLDDEEDMTGMSFSLLTSSFGYFCSDKLGKHVVAAVPPRAKRIQTNGKPPNNSKSSSQVCVADDSPFWKTILKVPGPTVYWFYPCYCRNIVDPRFLHPAFRISWKNAAEAISCKARQERYRWKNKHIAPHEKCWISVISALNISRLPIASDTHYHSGSDFPNNKVFWAVSCRGKNPFEYETVRNLEGDSESGVDILGSDTEHNARNRNYESDQEWAVLIGLVHGDHRKDLLDLSGRTSLANNDFSWCIQSSDGAAYFRGRRRQIDHMSKTNYLSFHPGDTVVMSFDIQSGELCASIVARHVMLKTNSTIERCKVLQNALLNEGTNLGKIECPDVGIDAEGSNNKFPHLYPAVSVLSASQHYEIEFYEIQDNRNSHSSLPWWQYEGNKGSSNAKPSLLQMKIWPNLFNQSWAKQMCSKAQLLDQKKFLKLMISFTKEADRDLVHLMNAYTIKMQKYAHSRQSAFGAQTIQTHDICPSLVPLDRDTVLVDYPSLWHYPEDSLRLRLQVIHMLNVGVHRNLSVIDWASTMHKNQNATLLSNATRDALNQCLGARLLGHRHFIYLTTKTELWTRALLLTMQSSGESHNPNVGATFGIASRIRPSTSFVYTKRPKITIDRLSKFKENKSKVIGVEGSELSTSKMSYRKSVLFQTWTELKKIHPIHLRQADRAFYVHFIGERSIDVGGPYRELLTQIVAEMNSERVVIPSANNIEKVGPFQDCMIPNQNVEDISVHNFLGQIMGITLRTKNPIELSMPPVVWKLIVCQHINRSDIIDMNTTLIRQHDFVLSDDVAPSARESVAKIEQQIINDMKRCTTAIREGIATICPIKLVDLFTWDQLEFLICGSANIDINELRMSTRYKGGLSATHSCVVLLWKVLDSFSDYERTRFLRFVSGRARLSSNFILTIQPLRDARPGTQPLPEASTCFSTLELPMWPHSVEELRSKLLYAINFCGTIDGDT